MAVSTLTAISEECQAFGLGNWQLEKHFFKSHLPKQCQKADYLAFRRSTTTIEFVVFPICVTEDHVSPYDCYTSRPTYICKDKVQFTVGL